MKNNLKFEILHTIPDKGSGRAFPKEVHWHATWRIMYNASLLEYAMHPSSSRNELTPFVSSVSQGGNQSKWPVDKVHHVIPAASAHQSYIPLTTPTPLFLFSELSRFGLNGTCRDIPLYFNLCICPLQSDTHILSRDKMSLANGCESLTQGMHCSQSWMYMSILGPVLHHSSQLATVPWSNCVAHMFQSMMGWLPLAHGGMSSSSLIWYCGWSLS